MFVEELFFLKKESERKKLLNRFTEWKMAYTKDFSTSNTLSKVTKSKERVKKVSHPPLSANTRMLGEIVKSRTKQQMVEEIKSKKLDVPVGKIDITVQDMLLYKGQ